MAELAKARQVELVGRKIRQLRKQHRLTQTELAQRIGMHQSDLSRMEQGEYRVSLDALFRILAEFEMSMGEFFGEVKRETATREDARILRQLQTLDDAAQREVEEFIAFKKAQRSGVQGPREVRP
jgi:transcriptional regulator with XRE-family HTH domain